MYCGSLRVAVLLPNVCGTIDRLCNNSYNQHVIQCNTQLHTEEHITCVSHSCTCHITHVMYDIHKYAFYSLFKDNLEYDPTIPLQPPYHTPDELQTTSAEMYVINKCLLEASTHLQYS